ncbi:winged helix-turn-helix domain-containing protein [Modestobacter roseus]|uniref:Helix-turn-helix protein n=1 Tax=Modestobacter roseus TaxID=1181884 RepID=A0A562IV20_9ACTN|nr:helix-turn-helix domain-containing protein [Modestobacter roseus]MQA33569.1 helix-turn-helix domain-containing protein [Modestobacter roseus]TWH74798.1 helix-turn-helix protein [Modestobacter roseus]
MTDDPGRRELRDPQAIRALAHPLRIALLEVLSGEGTATATRCAELLGESVASCSFHLRTLEKHGFIERAPGEGREKPWRLLALTQEIRPADDEAGRAAGTATDDFFLDHETARIRAWWDRRAQDDPEWRHATWMTGSTSWLTRAELAELQTEIGAVVERFFVDRAEGAAQRPGARPVRLFTATSVGLSNGVG